ncbi:MAG: hypothetical protein ABSC56_07560 [Solirubrobacteraceae bacterium]|jgi:hypothetical protein
MSDASNVSADRSWPPSASLAGAGAAAVVLVLVIVLASVAPGHHARPLPRTVPAHLAAEAPDPLAGESYPVSGAALRHAKARAPQEAAREAFLSPGAPSDQQILAELRQEEAVQRSALRSPAHAIVDAHNGEAVAPIELPLAIQEVIAGGNAIRDFPYVYGGGHRSFIDDAYDCSGSVSYALAAGGLIGAPETSGQLESWGAPGPGRYLTVFANAGHTFMYVDGVWFDTAGRAGPYSTRWLTKQPSLAGYAVRHYPGL